MAGKPTPVTPMKCSSTHFLRLGLSTIFNYTACITYSPADKSNSQKGSDALPGVVANLQVGLPFSDITFCNHSMPPLFHGSWIR